VTQQPKGSSPDPIGDLQRWLLRTGVRGVSRGVGGHVRTVFGGNRTTTDVWEAATAPPPEEAPECAWCPICRAARMMRSSGPGLASHVAAAGDTLATVVLEAVSTVESALAAAQRAAAENGARSGQGKSGGPTHTAPSPDSWGVVTVEEDAAEAGGDGGAKAGGEAAAAPRQPGPAGAPSSPAAGETVDGQQPDGGAPPQTPGGSPREPDDRG
jgi:hypothetical protein